MGEKGQKVSPEEIQKNEISRLLSDATHLQRGAVIDETGGVVFSEEQIEDAKKERSGDSKNIYRNWEPKRMVSNDARYQAELEGQDAENRFFMENSDSALFLDSYIQGSNVWQLFSAEEISKIEFRRGGWGDVKAGSFVIQREGDSDKNSTIFFKSSNGDLKAFKISEELLEKFTKEFRHGINAEAYFVRLLKALGFSQVSFPEINQLFSTVIGKKREEQRRKKTPFAR